MNSKADRLDRPDRPIVPDIVQSLGDTVTRCDKWQVYGFHRIPWLYWWHELIRLLPDVARCCQVLWVKHILQEALWIIGRCWKVLPLERAFKKDIDGIDSLGLRYDGLAAIAAMTCRHSGFVASSILRRKANPLWWLFLGWKSQELWRVRHELHSKLQSLMSLRVTHSPTKSI